MPTAAKLVAALSFALLAFLACSVLEGTLPEGEQIGHLYEVAIASAALTGWFVSGAARRTGYAEAAATGLRTTTTAVVVALTVLSVGTMWTTAMRGLYRGMVDAILDIFQTFVDFAGLLLPVVVLGTLFFGGMLAGMITEWAGRRWR
jgi:hypothetical protein